MLAQLIKKVKNIPPACGVYIFKDSNRAPLYVGKAGNLRLRMNAYLHPSAGGSRPALFRMLAEATDIEIQKTDSEIEALVLESRLIKTLKPRYNVLMRDDKQYFYAGFTNEQFPKIIITHQKKTSSFKLQGRSTIRQKRMTSFVGPFVSGGALKITLRTLRKIFPYCTCKRLHICERACLNYNIGIDLGYCCVSSEKLKVKSEKLLSAYRKNIEDIKKILKGQKVRVINELEKQMKRAAEKQHFESAVKLRNQLEDIQKILAHKKVIQDESAYLKPSLLNAKRYTLNAINRIEGYDISNIQGQFAVGSMVVFARDENGNFVPKKNEYRKFKIKTIQGANDPAMIQEVLARRLHRAEWKLPDLFLIDGGLSQRNAAREVLRRCRRIPFLLQFPDFGYDFAKIFRQIPCICLKIFTSSRSKSKNFVTKAYSATASLKKLKNPPLLWGLAKREEELYTEKGIIRLNSLSRDEENSIKAVRDEAHRFAISYYRKLHRKSMLPR